MYYAGLLGLENDLTLLAKTNVGRDINRPYLTFDAASAQLETPFVKKLIRLIDFRNSHPAFNGEFRVNETNNCQLKLIWENGDQFAELNIDLEKACSGN